MKLREIERRLSSILLVVQYGLQQLSVSEKVVSGFEQKLRKGTYTTRSRQRHGFGCNFVAIGPILILFDVLETLKLSPQLLLIKLFPQ